MSEKNWRPGDVAIWDDGIGKSELVFRFLGGPNYDTAEWQTAENGCGYPREEDVRRAVVLDLEDREQMERLAQIYREVGEGNAVLGDERWTVPGLRMQAALRNLAAPKPRIEEPTGWGAVIEDNTGAYWTLYAPEAGAWINYREGKRRWHELEVVRVLSEGVKAGESE